MDPEVQARLLELNRRFYQNFGHAYAEKRDFLQPGMLHFGERIPKTARVLDLGCGHGRMITVLHQQGFQGRYLGLDASSVLLARARERARGVPFPVELHQVDLADPAWHQTLPQVDVALCLAVLHHLPGRALRVQVLRALRQQLSPEGWLGLSVWNLTRSPRLKARVYPWEYVGLSWRQVEPGDLLVDWRHQGRAWRYIHQFTLPELETLLRASGFRLGQTFLADGEGQRLGLYVIAYPQAQEPRHAS